MTTPRDSGEIVAKIQNGEVHIKKGSAADLIAQTRKAEARAEKHDAKIDATKKPEKKKKPEKPEKPAKEVKFPVEVKINEYGFIGLSSDLLHSWGFKKTRKDKDGGIIEKGADHKVLITKVEGKIVTLEIPDLA